MTDNKTKEYVIKLFNQVTDMYVSGVKHLMERDTEAMKQLREDDESLAALIIRDEYRAKHEAFEDVLLMIDEEAKAALEHLGNMS